MSRQQRFAIGIVLAGAVLDACTASSPGPAPAPGGSAFEMIVLKPAPCPASVDATKCVRVKATNSGASGDGRCLLRGGQTPASGGPEEDVWGEWITLTNVPHGTSVERITPWEPALAAVGYCEPGLRS